MSSQIPSDINALHEQLDAAMRDARAIVDGLSEEQGTRRPKLGAWSVAECLDHLATANRVYLRAMQQPADRARARGRHRTRPAAPGVAGRLFIFSQEPPPRWWSRLRAPRKIRPREAPPLADAFASFIASQADVHAFLRSHGDLDLARIHFPNPFVRGIRFSLATGLHVITAHERRHLWQAWGVRRAIGRAPA
ncbi:MAG TPA: DinB family protein [Gemmatimonadaceae bacterium]|nr:DinB family protein [Gemmatimonadaceae bacterium]